MKTVLRITAVILALLTLSGCVFLPRPDSSEDTEPSESSATGTSATENTSATSPSSSQQLGWVTVDGKTYYYLRDGSYMTGRVNIGEHAYYFDAQGILQTGWVTIDNQKYYFLSDGKMARGQVQIDGQNHFFTESGAEVLVVNPWNPVPDGYDPDLVSLSQSFSKEGSKVSRVCHDALVQMITDCNKQCPTVYVISSYRTYDYQAGLFENRIKRFQNEGYDREEAERLAATVVAKPGTSEHHTGLAVDIIDTRSWDLTEVQETLPGQQWLMENCWRYGFILRYPKNTTDSTGIIYEPWHYRYVGIELATQLHQSNLTLEQYLENLTD